MSLILPIYFIDIETVPSVRALSDSILEPLFRKRNRSEIIKFRDEFGSMKAGEDVWDEVASLQAEFGKIVCVSIGKLQESGIFYVRSIVGRDEKQILMQLLDVFQKVTTLCAHNGKEFDYPYLFRRFIINDLPVPQLLNVMGKKPWEVTHLMDTMEMWGHLQFKYRCSLDLLATVLGLPSPKQEMNGSEVADVYYSMFNDVKNDELPFDKEKEALDKIGKYGAGDVVTLANVYCKLKGIDILKEEQIKYV